jgi:hypothetical protein
MGTWWLSFADPQRPHGSQFLGVAVVRAPGFVTATVIARQLGINPGGEVRGFALPDDAPVTEADMNRLLSHDEARAIGERKRLSDNKPPCPCACHEGRYAHPLGYLCRCAVESRRP